MTDCIIRAFGGCACKDGECAEQTVTPAPVVIFSWRAHLAAIVFGTVMAVIAFGFMSAWNEKLRTEAQINQEITYNGR